ncbi:MAG TPA: nucleotidyltransferase domain-containing protein [Tahibacter sp.]|nr:nucleotidyltransferase domain-containing protein [Tahibacter sp.]
MHSAIHHPASLPDPHRRFLDAAVAQLARDRRLVGVAAGGSYLSDTMDAQSDLDLVVVTEPDAHATVMTQRHDIAASLGPLLCAFTGEHVGEPRLLVCLYDAPLLHVDLKFVALPDVALRVEDPAILFDRDGRIAASLATGRAVYPAPDPQWIEDRFWVWVHYGGSKIERGEVFETLAMLSFLRESVLGPLALRRAGARPSGVRRIETVAPAFATRLQATVAACSCEDCLRALHACVALYRELRVFDASFAQRSAVEAAATRYLDSLD